MLAELSTYHPRDTPQLQPRSGFFDGLREVAEKANTVKNQINTYAEQTWEDIKEHPRQALGQMAINIASFARTTVDRVGVGFVAGATTKVAAIALGTAAVPAALVGSGISSGINTARKVEREMTDEKKSSEKKYKIFSYYRNNNSVAEPQKDENKNAFTSTVKKAAQTAWNLSYGQGLNQQVRDQAFEIKKRNERVVDLHTNTSIQDAPIDQLKSWRADLVLQRGLHYPEMNKEEKKQLRQTFRAVTQALESKTEHTSARKEIRQEAARLIRREQIAQGLTEGVVKNTVRFALGFGVGQTVGKKIAEAVSSIGEHVARGAHVVQETVVPTIPQSPVQNVAVVSEHPVVTGSAKLARALPPRPERVVHDKVASLDKPVTLHKSLVHTHIEQDVKTPFPDETIEPMKVTIKKGDSLVGVLTHNGDMTENNLHEADSGKNVIEQVLPWYEEHRDAVHVEQYEEMKQLIKKDPQMSFYQLMNSYDAQFGKGSFNKALWFKPGEEFTIGQDPVISLDKVQQNIATTVSPGKGVLQRLPTNPANYNTAPQTNHLRNVLHMHPDTSKIDSIVENQPAFSSPEIIKPVISFTPEQQSTYEHLNYSFEGLPQPFGYQTQFEHFIPLTDTNEARLGQILAEGSILNSPHSRIVLVTCYDYQDPRRIVYMLAPEGVSVQDPRLTDPNQDTLYLYLHSQYMSPFNPEYGLGEPLRALSENESLLPDMWKNFGNNYFLDLSTDSDKMRYRFISGKVISFAGVADPKTSDLKNELKK